jgi:DNA-binding transcriptional regulator LsrR (DeoR family)
MPQDITDDQIVATARDLGQDEFTRADIAEKLGVDKTELSKPFRQARRAGRLDKVRDDDEGTGHFRLTGK